jgi:hypothetical protein
MSKQTLVLSQANYETGAGTYKHVYFNATLQTWLMWCLTLAAVLALYESVKYLIRLLVKHQACLFVLKGLSHELDWTFEYINIGLNKRRGWLFFLDVPSNFQSHLHISSS